MSRRTHSSSDAGQQYSASALIFVDNRQLTCRLIKISAIAVQLYAAEDLPAGTYVRLNLTLPGVDKVLDVDGVISSRGKQSGHLVLGVTFFDPPVEFTRLVGTFIGWLQRDRARREAAKARRSARTLSDTASATPEERRRRSRTSGQYVAVPPSVAARSLDQRMTGPSFPRVSTEELRAVASHKTRVDTDRLRAVGSGRTTGSSRTEEERLRLKEAVEARWRRRQQDTRVRKELRQIYRDALEDLTREPGTDPGSKKER